MDVKVIFGLVMHRVFLAVLDNTIGDLVTHSETETETGKKTETNRGRVMIWRLSCYHHYLFNRHTPS